MWIYCYLIGAGPRGHWPIRVQHYWPFLFTENCVLNVVFDWGKLFIIKYDYCKDGSLEMRLYLIGTGPDDTGQYECSIPGHFVLLKRIF
jgi:hypothetical protein